MPDRRWRDAGYAKYQKCVKREKVPAQTFAALKKCGGIERPWSTGDNVNLAVGQGDLQATPLQLATAYSTIANGGRVVRPHLAMSVEDGLGRAVEEFRTTAKRHVKFSKTDQDTILQGLHRAALGARAARRPTCSRALPAGSSPCTARPVPWSGRGSPTSPGTPATCPIPAAQSSSS